LYITTAGHRHHNEDLKVTSHTPAGYLNKQQRDLVSIHDSKYAGWLSSFFLLSLYRLQKNKKSGAAKMQIYYLRFYELT